MTIHLSISQKFVGLGGSGGTSGFSAILYSNSNLEMNLGDIVHRTALRIKMHKITGGVVHHVALLKRGLENQRVNCQMVKGFCVIPQTKEACVHYWVREVNTGLDFDIGFAVACLKTPELAAIHPVLLEELPEGFERSDMEEVMIRTHNESLFDLYQKDQKEFWRLAPDDVRNFLVKFV